MSLAHVGALLTTMSAGYGVSPSMPVIASAPVSRDKCLVQTWFLPFHNMTLKLNSRVTIQYETYSIGCMCIISF